MFLISVYRRLCHLTWRPLSKLAPALSDLAPPYPNCPPPSKNPGSATGVIEMQGIVQAWYIPTCKNMWGPHLEVFDNNFQPRISVLYAFDKVEFPLGLVGLLVKYFCFTWKLKHFGKPSPERYSKRSLDPWCVWQTVDVYETLPYLIILQGYFYQISKGGHLRFWTFFDKFWTFWKNVDLSVCRRVQRSRYLKKVHICGPLSTPRGSEVHISHKTSKKGLENIQKSIAELLHLAAAATRRIIVPHATYQILDLFGLSKFPLPPPDKNITYRPTYLAFAT